MMKNTPELVPTYVRPKTGWFTRPGSFEYGILNIMGPGREEFIPVGVVPEEKLAQDAARELTVTGKYVLQAVKVAK